MTNTVINKDLLQNRILYLQGLDREKIHIFSKKFYADEKEANEFYDKWQETEEYKELKYLNSIWLAHFGVPQILKIIQDRVKA